MYYELLTFSILSITTFSVFIALPFYVLILVTILANRHVEPLNSEFFVIFFALGIADIACYLLQLSKKIIWFGYVPWFFRPVNEMNKISSFYYYFFWLFAFLHYQFTFFLTLNRFISIVWPVFYKSVGFLLFFPFLILIFRKWTLLKTYRLMFCCFLVSSLLSLPIPLATTQITQYTVELDGINRTMHYGPVLVNAPLTGKYITFIWSFHVYALVASSLILYSVVLRRLRQTTMTENRRKMEMQMFYTGLFVFILNFVFVVYFFLRDYVLVSPKNSHVHEWILSFISDIYDLPNGFVLWLTSSKIRELIIRGFRRRFGFKQTDEVVLIVKEDNKGISRPATATAMPFSK